MYLQQIISVAHKDNTIDNIMITDFPTVSTEANGIGDSYQYLIQISAER